MRSSFGAYYRPTNSEFEELWNKCVFILDTNVLLGLHRYPKEAYDDLMGVLNRIAGRLWIPHQVGIEYQKGRLSVIADQIGKYTEVTKMVADVKSELTKELNGLQLEKRHSAINPGKFLSEVDAVFARFIAELETRRKSHPEVSDHDKIRDQIDSLLEGRVGQPLSREDLDRLYAEGKSRYEQKRPPGYCDEGKSNSDEVYFSGGLTIRRAYGDLIIWRQIIAEASASKLKHIVFVTDDDKDDWWWKQSGKTIGPRPELIEEISMEADVSQFYMYDSARFLEFANQYLGAKVKEQSIDQVREISELRHMRSEAEGTLAARYGMAEYAVFSWLTALYPGCEVEVTNRFPDFIVARRDGMRMGFEVKLAGGRGIGVHRGRDLAYRGYYEVSRGNLNSLTMVFVADDERNVHEVEKWLRNSQFPESVHVIIGVLLVDDQSGCEPRFIPIISRDGSGDDSLSFS